MPAYTYPPGHAPPAPGHAPPTQSHAPPPAGAPVAAADAQHPWPIVAGALAALILVSGAILVILLSSGGEAHSGSITPTVTAVGTSALPSTARNEAPAGAGTTAAPPKPPARAPDETKGGPLDMVSYHSVHFTTQVPIGWSLEEDEVNKEGYTESKWRNPADSNDSLLVDFSPAKHLPLEQDAAPVHEALQRAQGYRELAYHHQELAGTDSLMWVFQISGDQRVDYFFEKCTTGFAVLGSTTPARFARLQATFQTTAQSVQSTCSG